MYGSILFKTILIETKLYLEEMVVGTFWEGLVSGAMSVSQFQGGYVLDIVDNWWFITPLLLHNSSTKSNVIADTQEDVEDAEARRGKKKVGPYDTNGMK